jgi:hypothetical protein
MMITQAVREARTKQDIFLLLTAYLQATRLADELRKLSRHITSLPLTGLDDVSERIKGLFSQLGMASRGLDDGSRLVIKEALYVFAEALVRLRWLETAQQGEGGYASQSNARRDCFAESSGTDDMETVHDAGAPRCRC